MTRHADNLNAGQDTTADLVREFGMLWPELDSILHLAQNLKEILIPQIAPRSLLSLLKEDLKEGLDPITIGRPRRSGWLWVGAAASLIAGGAGLFFWWRSRGGTPAAPLEI